MIFKLNPDINAITEKFVLSPSFADFKIIMETQALLKFGEMQNSKVLSHDEMLANKQILNFYMNFCPMLENNLKNKQDLANQAAKKKE